MISRRVTTSTLFLSILRRRSSSSPPSSSWLRIQSFPDLQKLIKINGKGNELSDVLNNDMSITTKSFQQSLQYLIHCKQYDAVLCVHNALPSLHRLVIPNNDLNFASMCAYSGLNRPLKARKLAKVVMKSLKQPTDLHTSVSLLLAAYCYANKLNSAEALLFTWIKSYLTNAPDDEHAAALIRLVGALDNGRNLSYDISPKEVNVSYLNDCLPGMRVWYSMSSMYANRGAWIQCQAVLRYLECAETLSSSVSSAKDLYVSPLHYHHTITSLARAQGFSSAIGLYKEQLERAKSSNKRFSPHPLSLVPLLEVLSQWQEVTHASAMMTICEEIVHIVTSLNNMSDDAFHLMHAIPDDVYMTDNALTWLPESGMCTASIPDGKSWRQKTLNSLLGRLFQCLGPNRGLNKFSADIAEILRKNGVSLPQQAIMAMIEGRSRANNWRGALELYPELNEIIAKDVSDDKTDEEKGKYAKGTMAYHWIAEAMLRDGATEDLAEFLAQENT